MKGTFQALSLILRVKSKYYFPLHPTCTNTRHYPLVLRNQQESEKRGGNHVSEFCWQISMTENEICLEKIGMFKHSQSRSHLTPLSQGKEVARHSWKIHHTNMYRVLSVGNIGEGKNLTAAYSYQLSDTSTSDTHLAAMSINNSWNNRPY